MHTRYEQTVFKNTLAAKSNARLCRVRVTLLKRTDNLMHHSVVSAQRGVELHCWQEQKHFIAQQSCLCTVSSRYMPDKSRETSMRHSDVCAQWGVELHAGQEKRNFNAPQCRLWQWRIELHAWQENGNFNAPQCRLCTVRSRVTCLTRAEAFYCNTVSSVHREEKSHKPEKSRDTLMHHSVVCIQRGVDLHSWQEHRHFNAPQCCLCTGRTRVKCLTRAETL
jgi:hypothetical protein